MLEWYPSMISSLELALEARIKQLAEGLSKETDRANKEVGDITSIHTELKKSIESVLKGSVHVQPMLFAAKE